MTTRDGVRLDADVHRPAGSGPWPVLLQRQAYGRRIACTICYAHPAWYAAQGYLVVVQDVRGRGSSEGEFEPGLHEAADGADAVDWAAALPGSSGLVGMYGFSYQAYDQLLAATQAGPALRALAPAMGPWDARRNWVYENGALRLKQAIGWGLQIAAETARRRGDGAAYTELAQAADALPLRGAVAARPEVIWRHARHSHVPRWLEAGPEDALWEAISPSSHVAMLAARDLPMLFIAGWFDTHLGSTLAMHADLSRDASRPLVAGPWQHFPWTRRVGALDFGPEAALDTDTLQIRWFDRWLKGDTAAWPDQPALRLFDMGTRQWRGHAAWPAGTVELHLSGSGRASIDTANGVLLPAPGPPGVEYLVHDPWRPAPATGGAYGSPAGPQDRSETESRGDVLTFTTPPLTEPLTLAGAVSVRLLITADQPSFDVDAVLSRVDATGRVWQLAAGHALLPADRAPGPLDLSLLATCATLAAGEALRLSLAAAAFPAYPVNPGSGADPAATPTLAARVTTLMLAHGGDGGSLLRLTIVSA